MLSAHSFLGHPSVVHADARRRELYRTAARARALKTRWHRSPEAPADYRLRVAFPDDEPDITQLAERTDRVRPPGALLLAERGGVLQAAMSINSGEVLLSPAIRDTQAVELLSTRRRQVRSLPLPQRLKMAFATLRQERSATR